MKKDRKKLLSGPELPSGVRNLKPDPKKAMALAAAFLMVPAFLMPVFAEEEDYSNEAEWYEKCTKVQTTSEGVKACEGFQDYQEEKKKGLRESISGFQSSIDQLTSDTEEMSRLAQEQKQIKEELDASIATQEEVIVQLETNIQETEQDIADKEAEIEVWDAQIKDRMKAEQGNNGANTLADLIMGSSSLSDMLRRITGFERITEADQDQIEELNRLKAELEQTKSEYERLKQDHENQKAELEEDRKEAEELEESYNRLVEEYEKQTAELEAQKRSAEQDLDSIKDFIISAELSASMDLSSIPTVDGFVNPVPSGYTSAGTWAYNGGGLHLGLDRAAPVGSPLIAPASGVIVAASNSQPSAGGYLGNWSGFPYGSGNFIAMVCEVNGTTYAISFSHLSNSFNVKVGDIVSQGQQIAQTGHSGNSSGPHTHIEVYNLGSTPMGEVINTFQKTGDPSFGTGWGTTATACENIGTTPCRERPEKFF